jgi:hypothetical protein
MANRRRPDPELELSIEDVTPEIALLWLEKNIHNRKLSERLVAVYAETMTAGEWRLNGEPIIFDKNGALQSGQHRLHAVVLSGVTIRSVVVRGADPTSVYSLDSGRKRRIADVLHLRGEVDVNHLGAALVWLWRWQNDAMDMPGESATNYYLLKLLDETPEIRDHIVQGRQIGKKLGFSIGLMTAIHFVWWMTDEEDCITFTNQLLEQANLPKDSPALRLIAWAHRAALNPRRPSQVVMAAVTVKAWNAFREHREVKVLSFKGGETFPKVL